MDDEDFEMLFWGLNTFIGAFFVVWVMVASVMLSGHFFGLIEISWAKLFAPLIAIGLAYAGIGIPLALLKRRAEIKNWERRRD